MIKRSSIAAKLSGKMLALIIDVCLAKSLWRRHDSHKLPLTGMIGDCHPNRLFHDGL